MDPYDGVLADEVIEQHKELDKNAPRKKKHLDSTLLVKRCLNKEDKGLSPDALVAKLNAVTHVRLDRECLHAIDGLELLGSNVKNLYMQQNEIVEIENLESLTELTFLTLSNNHISQVKNLTHFRKLGFLDLSNNEISDLDVEALPKSLVILSLEGNPCQQEERYRLTLLEALPRLRQLDGKEVPTSERRAAGHDLPSSSDEDSEEEEENNFPQINRPFDVDILGVFDELSTDIFMRCQSRIQEVFENHKERVKDLDSIKSGNPRADTDSNMSYSRISSQIVDSPDSSRPTTGENRAPSPDRVSLVSADLDLRNSPSPSPQYEGTAMSTFDLASSADECLEGSPDNLDRTLVASSASYQSHPIEASGATAGTKPSKKTVKKSTSPPRGQKQSLVKKVANVRKKK